MLRRRVDRARIAHDAPFVLWRDPDIYASFPTMVLQGDTVLLAFRAAPREPVGASEGPGHQQHLHPRAALALCRLDAGLKPGPITLFPANLMAADQDPNLMQLPDGALLMSSFSWRPRADWLGDWAHPGHHHEKTSGMTSMFWGSFTARSEDGGLSWQGRADLPPLPGYPDLIAGQRPWHGGRHRGQAVIAPDGRLLIATYDRPEDSAAFSSYLFESSDLGKSWAYAGPIAQGQPGAAGFAEPTLLRLNNGDLLALHRSFGAEDRLAICRSRDSGRRWSAPDFTDVVGHPFHVTPLNDDLGLLVYGRRGKISSIRARLIDLRSGRISAREEVLQDGATHRDIGYPSAVLLPDGQALIAYYWAGADGVRQIEAVRAQLV